MNNNRIYQAPTWGFSNSNLKSNLVYQLNDEQRKDIIGVLFRLTELITSPLTQQIKLFNPISEKTNKWKCPAWDNPVKTNNGTDHAPDSNILDNLIEYLAPISMNGYGDDVKDKQIIKLNNALKKIQICSKYYLNNLKKEWIKQADIMDADVIGALYQQITHLRNLAELSRPFEFVKTISSTQGDTSMRMEQKRVDAHFAGLVHVLDYYLQNTKQTRQMWLDEFERKETMKKRMNKPLAAPSKAIMDDLFTVEGL